MNLSTANGCLGLPGCFFNVLSAGKSSTHPLHFARTLLWYSLQLQGCLCLTFFMVPLQSSLPPAALFVLSKASRCVFLGQV